MWQIFERNPRAFLWALLLHLALAILIFSSIAWTRGDQHSGAQGNLIDSSLSLSPELQDRVAQLRDPQAFRIAQEDERQRQEDKRIQAEEEARQAAAAAEAERQRQAEQESRRRAAIEAERQAERDAAREAQRQVELQARREAEREARVQAELEAQRQAELEVQRRAEETAQRQAEEQAQREAKEQAQREAEEQAQREAEEQAQREAEEQAKREAEEQAQREAEEQARSQAAAAAARAQQLANEWVPRISAKVAQFWIRPQSLQVQVSTLVRLQLNPGGEVVPGSVKVIESSGYPAFDTSVVRAIMDASPLPVPDGDDFKVFKDFDFRFKP
ncbi:MULTISPECIES: cell envelope integrity protein TolA [Thiorhodovibrio]|uniref:cell envelope integrity protein TolA n=1 Tax=Thiorhodovibrio TaxID=61593 RepID=UPI0019119EC0|nr:MULTISPECIES: cell envelope integrity protein TolA [Thiorhodovibrio]MBK5968691.1 protein TolA [Thiorhodovibrio winogradskyi]WPL10951.1 IgA-specific serine endopeptidase autotransporter precursor [Thiorhodovibrio litoralis]